MPRWL